MEKIPEDNQTSTVFDKNGTKHDEDDADEDCEEIEVNGEIFYKYERDEIDSEDYDDRQRAAFRPNWARDSYSGERVCRTLYHPMRKCSLCRLWGCDMTDCEFDKDYCSDDDSKVSFKDPYRSDKLHCDSCASTRERVLLGNILAKKVNLAVKTLFKRVRARNRFKKGPVILKYAAVAKTIKRAIREHNYV